MGKVYRAQKDPNKAKKQAVEDENKVLPSSPLSDAAMERLAQIMNDSPTIVKLQGTKWEIRALKPGTQWMIAEEACKIVKGENLSMGDVIKEFAINIPSVARVITLSLHLCRINANNHSVNVHSVHLSTETNASIQTFMNIFFIFSVFSFFRWHRKIDCIS